MRLSRLRPPLPRKLVSNKRTFDTIYGRLVFAAKHYLPCGETGCHNHANIILYDQPTGIFNKLCYNHQHKAPAHLSLLISIYADELHETMKRVIE
jgi:hypothetical protein